jgi:hypothetical protein
MRPSPELTIYNLLLSAFLMYAIPPPRTTYDRPNASTSYPTSTTKELTLPVVKFFVVKVISVVPSGPGPTSHASVSSLSPGLTGAVNRTLKNLRLRGSPFPTVEISARAPKPKVDRPCRMTPPNPAAAPSAGSDVRKSRYWEGTEMG